MGGINSGRRATTPDTDECIRLSLSDLRRDGAVKRHQWSRRDRYWRLCGSREVVCALTIVIDIECRLPKPTLSLTGSAYGRTIDQDLEIVAQPQPFGGERFYVICPLTGRRCITLILPPGQAEFASLQGWRVPYASTREREIRRAVRTQHKLEQRWSSLSKYARKPKRRQLMQRLSRARCLIWEWEDDMMQFW